MNSSNLLTNLLASYGLNTYHVWWGEQYDEIFSMQHAAASRCVFLMPWSRLSCWLHDMLPWSTNLSYFGSILWLDESRITVQQGVEYWCWILRYPPFSKIQHELGTDCSRRHGAQHCSTRVQEHEHSTRPFLYCSLLARLWQNDNYDPTCLKMVVLNPFDWLDSTREIFFSLQSS